MNNPLDKPLITECTGKDYYHLRDTHFIPDNNQVIDFVVYPYDYLFLMGGVHRTSSVLENHFINAINYCISKFYMNDYALLLMDSILEYKDYISSIIITERNDVFDRMYCDTMDILPNKVDYVFGEYMNFIVREDHYTYMTTKHNGICVITSDSDYKLIRYKDVVMIIRDTTIISFYRDRETIRKIEERLAYIRSIAV